jgi:heptosyltransferase-2
MNINFDCKHYLGYKPCRFHKQDGRLCENCTDYRKIEEKILIVKLDALGDVLRTTAILPALHEKYNEPAITWVTRKNALQLLANNPYIHRTYAVEGNYLEFVLNESFDVGICLDADPLSASVLSLATCKEKLGFVMDSQGQVKPCGEESQKWFLMGVNDQLKKENRDTYQKHIYQICRLETDVQKPQIHIDTESTAFARRFADIRQLEKFKKIVGINTGGGSRWQFKKWILDRYIQLIRMLKDTPPHGENIGIILFGGPEEIEFNKTITKEVGDLVTDAGCHNSLLQFSALIDLTDVFFTPDSLGMHISIALDKPTIVNVGPTSPWELDVYGNGEIIYNDKLECISCYRSVCDLEINCMNTIEPERILESIARYL